MFDRLRLALMSISPDEATFTRRGFHAGESAPREHLERIGATFLYGYHSALEESDPAKLGTNLCGVAADVRGFAFEGASMALTLLDRLTPWRRNRMQTLLNGRGAGHIYMMYVGAGWALARLPWRIRWPPPNMDPLLGWLAVDGYGFHQGYFHWPKYITRQAAPGGLSGYAHRVFDQGLGRSLWFVEGADVTRIPQTIDAFPAHRQPDLWSGVGLACAYAGGVDAAAVATLSAAAGPLRPQFAQGVVFAAKARHRAGNPTDQTALACWIVCDRDVAGAGGIADDALVDLPPDDRETAYEVWRRRIQAHFAHEEVRV